MKLTVAATSPSCLTNPRPRFNPQQRPRQSLRPSTTPRIQPQQRIRLDLRSEPMAPQATTTLVGLQMPTNNDWTGYTCNLRFDGPVEYKGSGTFRLFEFVPSNGKPIFDSPSASWNSRNGYRNAELTEFTFWQRGRGNMVYSFKCPGPGKGLNYELVPTNGDVSIKWTNTNGGGPFLEIVNFR